MSDKYALLRGHLPELIEEAARKGGINPRAQMIIDLLADYDALQSRLDAAERKLAERDALLRRALHYAVRMEPMSVQLLNGIDALLSSAEPAKGDEVKP